MGGIKFEISGRLTRRYRADRALFIRRIFGGLNNIDSSFKRKSSVVLRGAVKSNVDSTILTSKRRIGAFAVKGWMSGRSYSSITTAQQQQQSFQNLNMDPWFITGFTDGDGCFLISVYKGSNYKLGWTVKVSFQIWLDKRDVILLEKIKLTLGDIGKISYKDDRNAVLFTVESLKELLVIVNHFEKYPLITKKFADFELFKLAVNCLKNKEHLTKEGLNKIISIKSSLNLGISDKLKTAFPNITPIIRPEVKNFSILDPQWLAGFTSAEGSFMCMIYKCNTKLGEAVKLTFQITQHARDEKLMKTLVDYFECGVISKQTDNAIVFRVTKLSDLIEKIIPFFIKYSIIGVKNKDFLDFCKIVELMQNKIHLTQRGLEEIKAIKSKINTGRKSD